MYLCDLCGAAIGPRKPCQTFPVLRPRVYPNGSEGTEIEREHKVCPACKQYLIDGGDVLTMQQHVRRKGEPAVIKVSAPEAVPVL